MIGVHYDKNHVATRFGNHLVRPIFHDEWHEDMIFEEHVKLLDKCMLVLVYHDRSIRETELRLINCGSPVKMFDGIDGLDIAMVKNIPLNNVSEIKGHEGLSQNK